MCSVSLLQVYLQVDVGYNSLSQFLMIQSITNFPWNAIRKINNYLRLLFIHIICMILIKHIVILFLLLISRYCIVKVKLIHIQYVIISIFNSYTLSVDGRQNKNWH